MRRLLAVAVVGLLVATTAVPPASAQGPTVPLHYDVELLDADAGRYRITASFSNLQGNVEELTLQGASYVSRYPNCRNLVIDGDPEDSCNGQFTVEVDGDALTYRYEAVLNVSATQDGFNSVTTDDWAVLQAAGIGFQFSYSWLGSQDDRPVFDGTLSFDLPEGWDAEASFPEQDGRFQLETRFPRPAGIVVLGNFTTTPLRTVGRDAVLVEIEPADQVDVADLVKATGSYLRSSHGDHLGDRPLFVVAPDPFKSGGVASRDGFAVHRRVDAQTVVHEWVHLWQRFEVCNRRQGQDCFPGDPDRQDTSGSTVWVKEGGAEFHSGLALHAAGEWSASRVQEHFDRIDDRYEEGELDRTVYGPDQDPAYTKGALAIASMDDRIRNASDATRDLGTVLREMNADAADETRQLTVTNAVFRTRIEETTGGDWSGFFEAYVDGTEDPGPYRFDPTGTLHLAELTVAPDPLVAGEPMTISANVTNTGTAPANRTVRFFVDGEAVGNATVELDAGGSRVISRTTEAPRPGTVRVEVGTLSADVEVLAPAELRLEEIRPWPAEPRGGRSYDVEVTVTNLGDLPAQGRVRLDLDGETVDDRSGTVDRTWTVRFVRVRSQPGTVNATATLTWSGPTRTLETSWTVAEPTVLDLPSTPGVGVVWTLAGIAVAWRVWGARSKR